MNLLHYVDEEIDEARGLEYLRKCSSAEIFHRILAYTWLGIRKAREIHPRGALVVLPSSSLVRVLEAHLPRIRAHVVTAPPQSKQFEEANHSTFLLLIDQEGQVVGVYKDTLSP